jgi:hypothetical protein
MTRIVVSVVAFLAFVAPAYGEKLDAAKVSLDPPTGWNVERKPEKITIANPNNEIAFVVLVRDGANDQEKKAALAEAEQILNSIAKDVKWAGGWKKAQTNGMPTIANRATATMAGKDGRVFVLVIESPAKKMVVFIAAVDAAKEKQYEPTIKAFIDSIKPA